MKRVLLAIFIFISVFELSAQEQSTTTETTTPTTTESHPTKEFLSSFTAIDVDAPIRLTLTKIGDDEAPYIIFDTKGVYTSKFMADVDSKTSTLKISERHDPKRESVTEVQIFFNTLTDITISRADVKVEGTITSKILDLHISHDANFVADIDVLDIMVFASGKSYIKLSGATHYQTADISTAEYNAEMLHSIATIAQASHNAIVKVDATERLEAKTATGGKLYYYTQPVILRSEITLFGGEIALK